MNILSQNKIILGHLQRHGSITSLEAFKKYEITRISARIYDLRKKGYDIQLLWETNPNTGTRYGRYVYLGAHDANKSR